jgi:RimJ/RimL family protein N-acetyltransferase
MAKLAPMTTSRTTDTDPVTGLPIGLPVDPAPARLPERTRLVGSHVQLVPLDAARHTDALYEETHGAGQDALWLYLPDGPFPDQATFRSALEQKATSLDPFFFAILDHPSGRALGHAAYLRITPAHRCIEVGWILYAPSLQRTVGATEAMYLLAKHAFEDLGYRRYEWKCDALNAPSRRAALRLGFTFEGIFRQHLIAKGRNRDSAWFSLLDTEWPARRTALERWLDPANFDTEGRQRLSLSQLNGVSTLP